MQVIMISMVQFPPHCTAFVYTVGTALPTEPSSEYLLMRMIKLEKLIVQFLMNMKKGEQTQTKEGAGVLIRSDSLCGVSLP